MARPPITVQSGLRGELIADDGEVVCEPGYGEYVHRERPDWDPNRR